MIREVAGVEVAEHRTDGNEQLGTLNLLEDFGVSD